MTSAPLFPPRFRLTLAVMVALLAGLKPLPAAELNVFAAASLTDALQEIARSYEPASGDRLLFNFAGSSTLLRQIKEGAPADVFFPADEEKMDTLAKAGLVAAGTRRSLLSNTLVIVVNATAGAAVSSPAGLAGPAVHRLALAEPHTVPAGIYARAWLEKNGLWNKISDRIVATENVRACLAAVESGNVDAGIVYKTDALISKNVKVVWEVPAADGPAISYPVAAVTGAGAKNGPAARRFLAWLGTPAARVVFAKYGFLPAP